MRGWKSYKKYAWLRDELAPVSGEAKTTFGGLAITLVDALDVLWIMDLDDDFRLAAAAATQLDFANTTALTSLRRQSDTSAVLTTASKDIAWRIQTPQTVSRQVQA